MCNIEYKFYKEDEIWRLVNSMIDKDAPEYKKITPKQILFKIFSHNAIFYHKIGEYDHDPFQINEKGDWIDLKCAEGIVAKTGDTKKLKLGISMKLPVGFEAILAPRSSSFDKFGFFQTNSFGVIDNSYSGTNDEWKLPAHFIKDAIIHRGDRIAQFRIQPTMRNVLDNRIDEPIIFINQGVNDPIRFYFIEMESLDENDRGGFGSTGIN